VEWCRAASRLHTHVYLGVRCMCMSHGTHMNESCVNWCEVHVHTRVHTHVYICVRCMSRVHTHVYICVRCLSRAHRCPYSPPYACAYSTTNSAPIFIFNSFAYLSIRMPASVVLRDSLPKEAPPKPQEELCSMGKGDGTHDSMMRSNSNEDLTQSGHG